MAREWAPTGLHQFVGDAILCKFAGPGVKAIDLGSGGGAMAERLRSLGCDVIAADLTARGYEASVPHVEIDLNQSDFADRLGISMYGLITAIEVIEHLENPISFLRNLGRMLSPGGVAVISTPNVDSLPTRLKFFLKGKIRMMDDKSEPTHISPIFFDLFQRKYLPLAGLQMQQHVVFPPNGFHHSRRVIAKLMRVAAHCFSGESILGDHHVLVLKVSQCHSKC